MGCWMWALRWGAAKALSGVGRGLIAVSVVVIWAAEKSLLLATHVAP